MITEEGTNAWYEAIRSLKSTRRMNGLEWSDGLALAAQDHCAEMGQKGLISYDGFDGSTIWDRIENYGTVYGSVGENLAYGINTGD